MPYEGMVVGMCLPWNVLCIIKKIALITQSSDLIKMSIHSQVSHVLRATICSLI